MTNLTPLEQEAISEILIANSLNESTTHADIAQTDEIISAVISQKWINSLAYAICDIQPLRGPTGGQFAIKYDKVLKKSIVKRTNVEVINDTTSDTGFTLEAIQDMQKQFGKRARTFIGRALSGISSANENDKLLSFMDVNSALKAPLTLSDPTNIETNMFQLSQKVAESVVEINSIDYRTLNSFCVVPLKLAATVLGIGNYFTDTVVENGLYMGKVGKTKFYLNPDPASTTAYVGLSGTTPGNSSIVFSPYQHQVVEAQDPESGNVKLFNVNRYAITLNGLSEVSNPMLHKFEIA